VTVVLDSNILIDHLNDVPQATALLDSVTDAAISVVTRIEVLAGMTPDSEGLVREFLRRLVEVPVSESVADIAVLIRRERRLKLPDAVILATARHLGCSLVTRNTKDFDRADPDIEIPYVL
jgi:predicted nucleic acid-binding protein